MPTTQAWCSASAGEPVASVIEARDRRDVALFGIVTVPRTREAFVLRRYRFDNLPGGILNIRGRAINALRDQLVLDLRRQQGAGPAR